MLSLLPSSGGASLVLIDGEILTRGEAGQRPQLVSSAKEFEP